MVAEWTGTTLGRLLAFSNGKSSPTRSNRFSYCVYGSNGVIGFSEESNADPNTIVIGRVGTYCGSLHYSDSSCWVTDNAIRATAVGGNDTEFLYYLLRTLGLNKWRAGSGQPLLNQTILSQIPVAAPSPPAQRSIAHILGTLDDKIELNRRMNETLEASARALFKSWFVDFDPVRAKMEGRHTGLPQEIADLFPDRLVDSELGEIPEGWEVGVFADAIKLMSGGTPRTSVADYWSGSIPWYTPKDAPDQSDVFVLDTQRRITQAGVDNSATTVLPVRTTVISARGTVGRLACLGRPMAMNQTCYGIRGASGYREFFTYWLVRRTIDQLRGQTHGTIFDTITRQTFNFINLTFPPLTVAEAFERSVIPIMERILHNSHEIRTLAALRDTLLPKLISGEIRVGDAEMALESVT